MAAALVIPLVNEAGVESSLPSEAVITHATGSPSEFLLFPDQSVDHHIIWTESEALCYDGDQNDTASYDVHPLQWASEIEYLETSSKSHSWPGDRLKVPSSSKQYSSPSITFKLPDIPEAPSRRSDESQRHHSISRPPLSPSPSDISAMTGSTHSDSCPSSLPLFGNSSIEMNDLWLRLAQDPDYVMSKEEFTLFNCSGAQFATVENQLVARRAVSRYWDGQGRRSSTVYSQHTETYSQQSNWRRNKKQPKPFSCERCPRSFGSKADLRRHTREIHKERGELESSNICPQVSCERHRKGFARRWNLIDHIRRRHREEFSNPPSREVDAMNVGGGDLSDDSASSNESRGRQTDKVASSTAGQIEQEKSSDEVRQHIQSALSALRARRVKLDVQIGTYERILSELDGQ